MPPATTQTATQPSNYAHSVEQANAQLQRALPLYQDRLEDALAQQTPELARDKATTVIVNLSLRTGKAELTEKALQFISSAIDAKHGYPPGDVFKSLSEDLGVPVQQLIAENCAKSTPRIRMSLVNAEHVNLAKIAQAQNQAFQAQVRPGSITDQVSTPNAPQAEAGPQRGRSQAHPTQYLEEDHSFSEDMNFARGNARAGLVNGRILGNHIVDTAAGNFQGRGSAANVRVAIPPPAVGPGPAPQGASKYTYVPGRGVIPTGEIYAGGQQPPVRNQRGGLPLEAPVNAEFISPDLIKNNEKAVMSQDRITRRSIGTANLAEVSKDRNRRRDWDFYDHAARDISSGFNRSLFNYRNARRTFEGHHHHR